MIYLDNSATTRKKPFIVKYNIYKALKNSANPTRSSHKASFKMAFQVNKARENLKLFFNATPNHNIIYTYNCSEALNYAILGTVKINGHIIITAFEHNSVLRPLYFLEKNYNISYTVINPNKNGLITIEQIKRAIKPNTYLIICNQTSNVTGTTTNIFDIGNLCKKKNILFLVDSAQSAGHEIIDIEKNNINMLAVAGHKGLLGPQGIGALITNVNHIKPIKFGGSGTNSLDHNMPNNLPDKLEAGTINTIGILGLDGGIKFVSKHYKKINKKINKLSKILLEYLKNNQKINLYSSNSNSGVISFKFKNLDCNEVANILNDKFKICCRSGLHCAPLIHKFLQTEHSGLIRISISYYNTIYEIKKLIKALKYLSRL